MVVVVGYEAAQIIKQFGDAFDGVPTAIIYVHQRERLVSATLCYRLNHTLLVSAFERRRRLCWIWPAVEAAAAADAVFGVEDVSPTVAEMVSMLTGLIRTRIVC